MHQRKLFSASNILKMLYIYGLGSIIPADGMLESEHPVVIDPPAAAYPFQPYEETYMRLGLPDYTLRRSYEDYLLYIEDLLRNNHYIDYTTLLMTIAFDGHERAFALVLSRGANPFAADRFKNTVAEYARRGLANGSGYKQQHLILKRLHEEYAKFVPPFDEDELRAFPWVDE